MNKYYFIISIFLIFICCNQENKKDNSNTNVIDQNKQTLFTANIGNEKFVGKNNFYEQTNENALFTAIADDFSKIMLNLPSIEQGTYQLDSSSFYTNDNGTYYVDEGQITIEKNTDALINGTFNFTAKNINGDAINVSQGTFVDLKQEQSLAIGNKINTLQYTTVDVENGTIKTTNANVEIAVNEQNVVFSDKQQINNSFSIQISEKQELPNAIILKANGGKYDNIYIDNIQKSVTIFLTNGNSITYK